VLATAKWTIADYHAMVQAGILADRRVELIQGDIVEMAPEGESHAYYSDEAGEYLIYLLGSRAKIRQAKPITLPASNSEPEPDIAIVQRLGEDYRQHHPFPENIYWLIEYADSSLKKDLEIKSPVYAGAGVPEYWVINLQKSELIVMRSPTQEGYQLQEIWTQDVIRPLAFPDLEIQIARILTL
jgi:Uma2 family endonuclease